MAINIHYHRFPGCGTKHNTACSTVNGRETNCFQALHGAHRGEWACIHVTGEGITIREFQEFMSQLAIDLQDNDREQQQVKG